ncbi:hypothetical protein NSA19_07345 [Actinomyces bowdenii]|uniref:hypothetical protein n=1 Tax=Actinomyces bowdenii TaxID=131109 RepID=UPI00214C018D|nr:hypothetical protein [Actinomyces bowdenii]MCR2052665.1 hypothetical protein [Actinomyces bowdenii]
MTPKDAEAFIAWRNAVIDSKDSDKTMTDLDGGVQTGWQQGSTQVQESDIIK